MKFKPDDIVITVPENMEPNKHNIASYGTEGVVVPSSGYEVDLGWPYAVLSWDFRERKKTIGLYQEHELIMLQKAE